MKVLMLNPPGSRIYLRDYYCTTISKSDYYYHPVDLLYLSGTLAREHEVDMLEAMAGQLSPELTLQRIEEIRPDVVLSLVAAPSFDEDHAFLARIKERLPEVRLIATGDIFREFRENIFLIMPFLEATLVDFSTEDILKYLRGANGEKIDNIIYRYNGGLVIGPEKHGNGDYSISHPKFELFPKSFYRFPFVVQEPFMTVLSDFGCPYGCTFCPVSTLGFKMRSIQEVISELRRLWEAGFREVHFRDQTFAVNKRRTIELCAAIREALPKLTWSCFSRVDVLDEERLDAMAAAGCHTVIVGIEFDDDQMQKVLKKNINKSQMFQAVKLCHEAGIRIAGTFILGLPEHDREDILRTGALARALNLDFASFNLATPRLGTSWRQKLIRADEIDRERWKMDTVEGTTAWKKAKLDFAELTRLRSQVERDFYMRPSYLLKRLWAIRSPAEAATFMRNGLGLILSKRNNTSEGKVGRGARMFNRVAQTTKQKPTTRDAEGVKL